MTMTHKEALAKAIEAFYTEVDNLDGSDMEAAIRAYIEARGLVMVPKEPDDCMIEAGYEEKLDRNSYGMAATASDIYTAMLAAAPDPFKEEQA